MKKTNERKWVALLLCSVLLVLTFSACSKKNGTDNSSDGTTPSVEEPMTIVWYNQYPPYEDDSWGEKAFEELFGVDVEIVRAENADELSTLLAGGQIPDVMFLSTIEEVGTYQNLGILASLTEDEIKENMPSYYEMCKEQDENFFTYSMIDGKNYGITKIKAASGIAQAAVIRADWLKACGFDKVPSTLEELEEVFTAFTYNDPDGNGINDTYALTSGSDKENGKRYFSSIFGAYGINPFCWTVQDNEAVFGFVTEECKDALKLLNSWYEKGLIDPEFVTDESRTSGTDIAYKFANGITGFVDGFAYDDYQWDNDAHVNAKWVASNESWQNFFASNEGNEEALYGKKNVTDFSSDMIDPYYILIDQIVGPAGENSGYYAGSNISGYVCFGLQLEEDREKMYKIMNILEQQSTNSDIVVNHYGPEGYIWEWNEDKTRRQWIDNYSEKENYNAQGQAIGNGQCLWAMYNANADFLSIIGGARMDQRYEIDLPTFSKLNTVTDAVKVSLKAATENPDLIYAYPLEYIVKAIRGDVDIDSTWDATIEKWYKNGGTQLTKEANEWYSGTQNK
ncbi:hypothetical protein [Lachnoclostridium phytofermentans]|uniref:hypothetical protein n=1 Tax=Lachnoclostridium phytofermentans TaxID=66219 RepID=UPI0004962205|nr:hypothetical protein [Lachnoclostridium phytofermentans]